MFDRQARKLPASSAGRGGRRGGGGRNIYNDSKPTRTDAKEHLSATANSSAGNAITSSGLIRCRVRTGRRANHENKVIFSSERAPTEAPVGAAMLTSSLGCCGRRKRLVFTHFRSKPPPARRSFHTLFHEEDSGGLLLKPWHWKLLLAVF